jgi:hypothetical protein
MQMMTDASIVLATLAGIWFLAYHRANGLAWSLGLGGFALAITFATGAPPARRPRYTPRSGS